MHVLAEQVRAVEKKDRIVLGGLRKVRHHTLAGRRACPEFHRRRRNALGLGRNAGHFATDACGVVVRDKMREALAIDFGRQDCPVALNDREFLVRVEAAADPALADEIVAAGDGACGHQRFAEPDLAHVRDGCAVAEPGDDGVRLHGRIDGMLGACVQRVAVGPVRIILQERADFREGSAAVPVEQVTPLNDEPRDRIVALIGKSARRDPVAAIGRFERTPVQIVVGRAQEMNQAFPSFAAAGGERCRRVPGISDRRHHDDVALAGEAGRELRLRGGRLCRGHAEPERCRGQKRRAQGLERGLKI